MILAIILFALATGIAVWSITMISTTKKRLWSLFLLFSVFCLITGIAIMCSFPTNKDVKEGKAHYVEQNHIEIVNGDTISNYKTYKIEWVKNFK